MSRWSPLSLALALVALPALAQVELKNDGFTAGGQLGFQSGFVVGEMAAVRLTAPSAQMRLDQIQLMFGGAATTKTVTVRVWDDTAGTDAPGTELFFADYDLTGADSALQTLDVRVANVTVPQTFRVGLEFKHAGLPSVARDDDGTIDANANLLYLNLGASFAWSKATAVGLTGDLVIRAVVSDPNADAGVDAGTDAGPGTDAGTDAGTTTDAGTATDGGSGTDAGTSCVTDADCGLRNFCDRPAGRCVAGCRADADCGSGQGCNELGQCVVPPRSGCGCTSVDFVPFALLALMALGRRTLLRR